MLYCDFAKFSSLFASLLALSLCESSCMVDRIRFRKVVLLRERTNADGWISYRANRSGVRAYLVSDAIGSSFHFVYCCSTLGCS